MLLESTSRLTTAEEIVPLKIMGPGSHLKNLKMAGDLGSSTVSETVEL